MELMTLRERIFKMKPVPKDILRKISKKCVFTGSRAFKCNTEESDYDFILPLGDDSILSLLDGYQSITKDTSEYSESNKSFYFLGEGNMIINFIHFDETNILKYHSWLYATRMMKRISKDIEAAVLMRRKDRRVAMYESFVTFYVDNRETTVRPLTCTVKEHQRIQELRRT